MRFVRLTADAYATFMSTVERQFVPQMPEYGLARQADGHEVEYVGVVDGPTEDSEKVIGAGLLLFQPWKKFFQRGLMNYGLDWENKELVNFFFTELTAFLRKNHPKVLAVSICPLVPKNFYEDIHMVRSPSSARMSISVPIARHIDSHRQGVLRAAGYSDPLHLYEEHRRDELRGSPPH